MKKKMTKEDLQRVKEIVSHFEGVVDKIDTDEWKTESMKDYMKDYRLSKKSLDNPGNLECPDKM